MNYLTKKIEDLKIGDLFVVDNGLLLHIDNKIPRTDGKGFYYKLLILYPSGEVRDMFRFDYQTRDVLDL